METTTENVDALTAIAVGKRPATKAANRAYLAKKLTKASKKGRTLEEQVLTAGEIIQHYANEQDRAPIKRYITQIKSKVSAKRYRSLAEVLALLDDSVSAHANGVQMLTLHASKGLEYDAVIIIDVVDGHFPDYHVFKVMDFNNPKHGENTVNMKALAEERRLFYVGVTRPRNYLYVLSSRYSPGNPYGKFLYPDASYESRLISGRVLKAMTVIDLR